MTYKRRHVKFVYQYSYMQCETHTSVYITYYNYIYICHIELLHPRENVVSVLAFLRVPAMSGFGVGGLECGSGTKNFSSFAYFVLLSPCLKTLKTNGNTFLCGWVLGAIMGHLFFCSVSLSLSLSLCMLHSMCPFSCVFLESFFVVYVCGETYIISR